MRNLYRDRYSGTSIAPRTKGMGASFRSYAPGPQSGTRRHQGAPRDRLEISICDLSQSSTDATKHTSTNSTIDCEGPLQKNFPLTTPLPPKNALLPTHTPFTHPTLHTSVRSTLTPSTPQRFAPMIHRLPRTCLQGPTAHRLGLHLRRTAKSSGSSIKFPQSQIRKPPPSEMRFARWKAAC